MTWREGVAIPSPALEPLLVAPRRGSRHGVVIMAGGLAATGAVPDWVMPRVACAVAVSRRMPTRPLVVCSSSFTMNKLPVQKDGRIISEASRLAEAFRQQHGKGEVICEQQSHDTVGSAVFLSLLYFRHYKIRSAAIISSDWHMDRCAAIFGKVASLSPWIDKLTLIGAEDGAPALLRAKRVASERKSLALFKKTFGAAKDMDALFRILVERHTNYNASFSARKIQTVLF